MKLLKYIVVTALVIIAIIGDIKTALGSDKSVDANKIKFAVETSDVWTPTFQLCWNELINLVGTDKIYYVKSNPKLADELNLQPFNKQDLNDKSYYISVSKMTKKHKNEIKKAIWKKFKEKSDILDEFKFENVSDKKTNKWFIYSMLLKNFEFYTPFKILESDYFNNSVENKYKYFGFTKNITDKTAKEKLEHEYMENLFYINDDDFALMIADKNKQEEMILYLTDSDKSFDDLYNEMLDKINNKNEYIKERAKKISDKYGKYATVKYDNYYKIPFIHIDEKINYDKELAHKDIKDKTYNTTGYTWEILKTLQTIKFDMNNEGAKLKSEAAVAVMMKTALLPSPEIHIDNNFYFDRPFVLFLKEVGKDKPYFAAKIKDGKYLIKAQ